MFVSDETDDWDFDGSPKPNEVQNDMYVRDEEEEEGEEGDAEDLNGRKVVVRWLGLSLINIDISPNGEYRFMSE